MMIQSCSDIIAALTDYDLNIEAEVNFLINEKPQKKWRALHMTIQIGNFASTSKLLKLEASPDARTDDLDTALHLTAR